MNNIEQEYINILESKIAGLQIGEVTTIAKLINYDSITSPVDPLTQGKVFNNFKNLCEAKGIELYPADDSIGGLAFHSKFIVVKPDNNSNVENTFKNEEVGYSFKLNSDFREITPEERVRANIDNNTPTVLISKSQNILIKISLDGFYPYNNLNEFYETCKKNMIDYGYQVISEEYFKSTEGLQKEAYKLLAKHPQGPLQVSYFMQLSDNTDKGYAMGCITSNPKEDHGVEESYIIEMINNWEYISK